MGKKREGGVCEGWNFREWQMGPLPEKNLKITFFTVAPFIVKMGSEIFKYLDAQQVSQQISIFFKSKFHNEWGVCQKSYFDVFFWQWSHLSFPKISTLTDPPFTFFAYIPKIFGKYQMPIFFIEYLGSLRPVITSLMCIWSKLSKTRPLHFQIFQIPNAIDRPIVHCWNCKK